MYQIISIGGDVLFETDAPHYIKLNFDTNAWIPATADEAECVVVDGKRFCLYGKPFLQNSADVVFVKKVDGSAKLHQIAQNSSQNLADILDVAEALCEIDRKQNILFSAVNALNKKLEALQNG